MNPPGPAETQRLAYLPALDGVRALAVGMVIIYHLDLGVVVGGFLGVDLFFVLSGFLITTLLLREFAAEGRIDLPHFWLRRARRLLPALFLLLAAIALWAFTASPFERDQLRGDILAALAYVANWRFIVEGQSYFAEFSTPSPVRHLWSLAIEEQFYVVWPLICLVAFGLAFRARRHLGALVGVLAVATVASVAALALSFDEFDPSFAYYATHTRAHELLVGALVAVLVERRADVRALVTRFAVPLALGGMAVVLAFGALLSDVAPFYYYGGSLVFSIGAAALIAGLALGPDRAPLTRVLSLRPIVYLGAISYGLYLWHWPIVIWLSPERVGLDGWALAALRVAATLAVSSASFFLVEQPIRRGRLGGIRLGIRQMAAASLVVAVALAGLTVVATHGGQELPGFVKNNRKLIVTRLEGSQGAIGLIGDSVAMSLYPGFASAAEEASLDLVGATFPGCPVGEIERVDNKGAPFPFARRCPETVRTEQARMVAEFDPEVVFWISNRERLDIREGDTVLQAGTPEWEAAAYADWDAVLERLTAGGAHVVVLLPFHRTGDDPAECAGGAWRTPACTTPNLSINALRAELTAWAARHPDDVTVVEPDSLICPTSPCTGRLEGVELRTDRIHYTPEGAVVAVKRLLSLLPDGIWPG